MNGATTYTPSQSQARQPTLWTAGVFLLSILTSLVMAPPALGQDQSQERLRTRAQVQEALGRLEQVLPEGVREHVMARIREAQAQELPAQAMANLALEGVAKGRPPEQVLGAVEGLAGEMTRAQEMLRVRNRQPAEGDVQAATVAMRMGVDGEAVRTLARTRRGDRSMAVPLMVMAGLQEQGMKRDQALERVRTRLQAGVGDGELMNELPEQARLRVRTTLRAGEPGMGAGNGVGMGNGAGQGPMSGVAVPVGPPTEAGPPAGLPGRGPKGSRGHRGG